MSEPSSTDLSGSGFIDPERWGDVPSVPRRTKLPGSGRAKGTRNKKTIEREKLLVGLKVDGADPVSFFVSILKNEAAPLDLRFAAAKELAPYAHPKLSSIEARTGGMSHEDRLEQLQKMLEQAPKQPTAEEGGYP